MGQRQRTTAYFKARDAGATACIGGIPRSENPYQPGEWSLHGWWDMGWQRASIARNRRLTPAPTTPTAPAGL